MDDYISRQTVMNAFAEYVRRSNYSDFASTPTWNDAVEIVESLPSADVQPHQLTEEDLTELRHRFGDDVEYVVRDMISGKEERWLSAWTNKKRQTY